MEDKIESIILTIKLILLLVMLSSPMILLKILKKALNKLKIRLKRKKWETKNYRYQQPYYQYKVDSKIPYKKRYFLTMNELNFYKILKHMSDKYNLCVISKIRLADLVEVDTEQTREYNKYFAKIKSKHIDFALAEPKNLEIKCLIELDDSSHNKQDRIERDLFVNNVCSAAGYKLFRTYGDISDIETFIAKNPLKRYIQLKTRAVHKDE